MQAVTQSMPMRSIRSGRCRRRRTVALRRLLAAAVVLMALLAVPQAVRTLASNSGPVAATHVVAAGETLWDIAADQSRGQDIRKVVAAIQEANGLKSAVIWPGQVLVIPAGVRR